MPVFLLSLPTARTAFGVLTRLPDCFSPCILWWKNAAPITETAAPHTAAFFKKPVLTIILRNPDKRNNPTYEVLINIERDRPPFFPGLSAGSFDRSAGYYWRKIIQNGGWWRQKAADKPTENKLLYFKEKGMKSRVQGKVFWLNPI